MSVEPRARLDGPPEQEQARRGTEGQRRALLVANFDYQDPKLKRLRSPAQDAEELARVLADPAIGAFEAEILLNETESTVSRQVARFFAGAKLNDLLLLHFACHGVKDDDGNLYFAASDTEVASLDPTAVSAEFVNRQMARSRSRRIVLLLDCCYSGAFATKMLARGDDKVHLGERFGGRGRIVLTASNAMEYAWEGDELSGAGRPSVFTTALVNGLATGAADRDGDGVVSVEELYDYVYDRVQEATPNQTPGKWAFDVEGELAIARSTVVRRPSPGEVPPAPQQKPAVPEGDGAGGGVRDADRAGVRDADRAGVLEADRAGVRVPEGGAPEVVPAPRRFRLPLGAVAACVLALAGVAAFMAVRPGAAISSRKILFTTAAGGSFDIYAVSAEGTGAEPLTMTEGDKEFDPAWSPDGSQIAFVMAPAGSQAGDVYVMEADGSDPRPLTDTPEAERRPAWSPDGSQIAFVRSAEPKSPGDIYVMGAEGGEAQAVTETPEGEDGASWSPDGARLAFGRSNQGSSGDIYVISPDGSGENQLTTTPETERLPAWSPDGASIAFIQASDATSAGDVFVMKPNGAGTQRLTSSPEAEDRPAWSPEGDHLAFRRAANLSSHSDIWVMAPSGANPQQVTTTTTAEYQVAW